MVSLLSISICAYIRMATAESSNTLNTVASNSCEIRLETTRQTIMNKSLCGELNNAVREGLVLDVCSGRAV